MRWTLAILIAVMLCACAQGGEDPNGVNIVVWPNAGDNVGAIRLGAEWKGLEAYVEPRYDKALASEGDVGTDLRVYGIYNTVDADLMAQWFGSGSPLPDGVLYAGIYGGWEFEDGQMEVGWLIGGRIEIKATSEYQLDFCTEYQRAWQTFRDDNDRYVLMVGPRLRFK